MPCQNHPAVHEGLSECWRCRREFCQNCTLELRDFNFCSECKTAQVRDFLAGTDIFGLDYAPTERRFGAWLIDGGIKLVIYLGVFIGGLIALGAFSGNRFNGDPSMWIYILFFGAPLASNLFDVVCHILMNGQSPGKLAMSLRVVGAMGDPVTWKQVCIRSGIKYVLFCATFGNICFSPAVAAVLDGVFALGYERASLHDLMAKTRVINAK